MFVGKRIREIRLAQKMKLKELAKKSGVQIATLSRIENMKMTGTLASHLAIAKAFAISLAQLYHGLDKKSFEPGQRVSQTQGDIFSHNEKSSYDILTTDIMHKRMMPILLKIEPGGRTSNEQGVAGAERFIFVLDGKLEVNVAKTVYTLGKYHTLYFDAGVEHSFANPGTKPARALSVITPVTL